MTHSVSAAGTPPEAFWLGLEDCRLDDFERCIARQTTLADYPLAAAVQANVPLYDCGAMHAIEARPVARAALLAEWGGALLHGPGLVVLQGAVGDADAIDQVSAVFRALIAEQHASGAAGGDHFAKPGANDRIWNAQQKLCLRAPTAFARYYSHPMLHLICEAWLGPDYQITSQVNVVNPGGAAQAPHRDFHLGFMAAERSARYPAHAHRMSAALTLQGAVAHCDMPLETGPTLYLPYSQNYLPGFLAYHRPEFQAYFADHHVQLPLRKGDAVFFNPALFHAAGHNRSTSVRRMANLIQVSSAFGRAMETLDRAQMCRALYPALLALRARGDLCAARLDAAVAACAEGYAFPSNLDRDQPIGGMAPPTQQDLMRQALAQEWPGARFDAALADQQWRRQT